MAAIVRQYGDDVINDVRIVPINNYESFDDVLLIEEDIDKSESFFLSNVRTIMTTKCE